MHSRPPTTAEDHPAAPLLQAYGKHGCPVDVGKPWSVERIIAAIKRGAHPSAKDPDALEYLRKETAEKVEGGWVFTVRWGDIKHAIPPHMKVSPVALIPHKSRSYRVILDLSFQLLFQGQRQPSINDTTNIQAPQQAMAQLGWILHRIMHILATHYNPDKPFKFCKVDVKDGFWRLSVSEEDAWHFCYTVPPSGPNATIDDTIIVVPNALQMGWTESPAFFCAASETARDIPTPAPI